MLHLRGEALGGVGHDLEPAIGVEDADRADIGLGHAAQPADQRDQPFRVRIAAPPDRHAEPRAAPGGPLRLPIRADEAGVWILGPGRGRRIELFFGRRHPGAGHADQGGGDPFGGPAIQQHTAQRQVLLAGLLGQDRLGQEALLVPRADQLGARRVTPAGVQTGRCQQLLGPAPLGEGHQQDGGALPPGAPGPSAAVQQRLLIGRQVGMDHEVEVWQIEPAGCHVGGDADAGAAIPQGLQGCRTLMLAELARQRHGVEPPFH